MLKLIFNGRWYVQLVLAIAAFAAAVFLYLAAQQHEAEKAKARAAGMPQAVSLSSFDPEKDIHAADEVHVTGWLNPDYTYQLTEERRRRSDVVRRMFVLFGPEDAQDTKTVRAVLLMPEGDVDRLLETVVASVNGQVAGNPVFSLNGTASRSATLDNMADEALAEKGLTKAPGFRYLEMWPVGGRDAGLAPDASTGTTVAAAVGGLGLFLLLIAGVKFSRRNAGPAFTKPAMAAPAGFAGFAPRPAASATVIADAPPPAPKKPGWMPAPQSFAFLGLAMLIGVISTWTGHWQLTVLAFGMGAFHFVMRVKTAMDKGVEKVAAAFVQTKAELAQNRLTDPAASGPVTRTPSPVNRLIELGQTTPGKKVVQIGLVAAMVIVAPIVLNDSLISKIGQKLFVSGQSDDAGNGAQPPAVTLVQPVAAMVAAVPAGPAVAPGTEAPVMDAPAQPKADAASPLIPEAAALRPAPGEAGAPSAPEPALALAPEIAAPAPVEPASTDIAQAEVASDQSVAAEPAPAETAAAPDQPAAPMPAVAAGLGSLGVLAMIAPVIGAVILAVAAFALMRGRQAEPPAVFAGRDPWSKLAHEARAGAGA